ncbi:MAG: hypothetical protein A2041_00170 [Bacteroidetes bacterium GWA2_31_9b]|nr:MAG: hypothetical protein A2041_00170 [Bacteroidetes bacterium GWA2_31_9b]
MIKNILIISVFAAFIVFAASCGSGSHKTHNHSEMLKDSIEVYYSCTMHPEVHSDKPGKCPKCGMTLVKKEMVESDSIHMHHDTKSTEHQH